MKNTEPQSALANTQEFIDEIELRRRLKVSRRTIFSWRTSAKVSIPFVRIPGSRLIRYHWPSIQNFLLRQQRNGGESA
jgi:hypothetical protein